MNEVPPIVRAVPAYQEQTPDIMAAYTFWFGLFLNHLPKNPDQLTAYCTQEVPYATAKVHFDNPAEVAKLIQAGYIPSPSPYDVANTGSTANWLMDTWFSPERQNGQQPQSTKEREVAQRLDQQFGTGAWKLVLLNFDGVSPDSDSLAAPLRSMVFLQKQIAVSRYGLAQRFRGYPEILAKLGLLRPR